MTRIISIITVGLIALLSANVNAQSYCTSRANSSIDTYVNWVSLGSINYQNSSCATYTNNTALSTVLLKGNTYTLTVRTGDCNGGGTYTHETRVWIDWNNDGDFYDAGEEVLTKAPRSSASTEVRQISVPQGAAIGTTRMRVVATEGTANSCGTYSWGETEDYTVEILGYQNSASIGELVSPGQVLCGSANQVQVKISNDGIKPLTSLEIGGYVNSVSLGQIPLTTANWTGNIPSASVDTAIYTPFSYSTGFQIGDELVIWTALPNGVTDTVNGNDTMRVTFRPGLSGSITVGDTTGGANDFPNLANAVSFIDSVGAICDTFYVYLSDTIVFNEQITVSPLLGSDETAPVIFTTRMGASGKAKITHNHTGSGNNFTVEFGNDASHYIFDNLEITSGPASSIYYNCVVSMRSNSHHNMILNCDIIDEVNYQTTSYYAALISSRSSGSAQSGISNYTFMNNNMENGSYGFYLYQTADESHIEGNHIEGPYYMGIYNYYSDGNEIVGNTMVSNSPYSSGYGMYIYGLTEPIHVLDNTIHPGIDEWPRQAIYLYNSTARANDRNIIANNRISVGQAWSGNNTYAIYAWNSGFTDIINNSFAVSGSSFDAYGLYLRNAGAMRVFNNSIAMYGSGVAVNYDGNSTVIASENNNLYTTGLILGSYNGFGYQTLAAWQNNAGYDATSISGDPAYYQVSNITTGLSDLHVCGSALDGAANPAFSPMYDMDGDMRDVNNPDIGADEFAGLDALTLGDDITFCPGDSVSLEAPSNLTGNTVLWSNGSTDQSIVVNMPGSYTVELTNACGIAQDTIMLGHPDVVDLDVPDTLICQGDMINVSASLSNASYSWSNGENGQTIMVDAEGEYVVTAIDENGCTSMDTIDVMISENARLNTSASDTILCPGQFLSLESGVDPRTGVSYTWSGFIDGSTKTTNNVLLGWDEAGTLVIEVNDNSCISYDTLVVDNAPAPVATFTSTRRDGKTFTFTPDSTHPRFQYSWDFGDRTTSSMESPTHLYNTHGTYTVVLNVTTLCGATDEQDDVVTFPFSVDELATLKTVRAYPNPSSGILNIDIDAAKDVSLEITDLNGKVVYSNDLGLVNAVSTETVDLSNIAKGVYMLRVDLDGQSQMKKITLK